MSVHFYATKIVVTTGPAKMIGHDGEESINQDCPPGTVLCYDAEGNLYKNHSPFLTGSESVATDWPKVGKNGVQLYRDFWRHIQSGADTPYGRAFRDAPHRVLREKK